MVSWLVILNYTFLTFFSPIAWVRVSEGTETTVSAAIITKENSKRVIASGNAYPGCWTMLKGGFQPEFPLPTELYFVVSP